MEGIVNPPWVYGPKEVGEWISATYGNEERKSKERKKIIRKEVKIGLFWRKEISNGWLKMFRYCEDDPKGVAILIIKALYKTGFKKILDARHGRRHLNCRNLDDLEETLSSIKGRKLRFVLAKSEIEKAHIITRRFYPCNGSSTIIRIEKGTREDVARFLNILKDKGLTIRYVRYLS